MFQIELTRHQLPAFVTELVLDPVPEFILAFFKFFKFLHSCDFCLGRQRHHGDARPVDTNSGLS